MILAAAMLAQVLLTPPKVSPVQEPLVRELLQVTNARQRARDVIRTVLSFNNYQSMPAIPADDAFDSAKAQASLNRASEVQNRMYKRLFELTVQDANLDEAAWYIYAPLYGDGWTDDELRQMIAFYRTPLGQKMIARDAQFRLYEQIRATEFFGSRLRAARQQVEREELLKSNPARAAAADMRMLAIELDVYAVGHGDLYPRERDPEKLRELFGPVEHRFVDPWGTPFRFEFSSDRKHYRITSAGSDRKFDTYDAPWGAKPRIVDTPGVDIVYEDGIFVLYPPGAVDQRL
jgi:hypothetical protein